MLISLQKWVFRVLKKKEIRPFAILLVSIFVVEYIENYYLDNFPFLSIELKSFIDALILILVLFPVIYFFVLLPFKNIIEKLKLSEASRIKAQAELEALINSTSDLMFVIDENYTLITANRPYLDFYEKAAKNPPFKIGDNVKDDLNYDEMHKSIWLEIVKRGFNGESFSTKNHVFVLGQNCERWSENSIYPIRENGKVTSIAIFSKDISETVQNEEMFRAMFKEHSAKMMLIDAETLNIIDVNLAAIKFYGYSSEQFCTKSLLDITALSESEVKEGIIKLEKTGSNTEAIIVPNIISGGEVKMVQVRSSIINQNNRRILFAIAVDVTQKLKTEIELKERTEKLNSLVEALPDMIFGLDRQNKYIYVHSQNQQSLRLPKNEYLGKHLSEVLQSEEVLNVEKYVKEAKETGNVITYESCINLPTGEERCYEHKITKTSDDGALVIVRNITENVKNKKLLEIEKEKFESIVNTIPDMLFFLDENNQVTYAHGSYFEDLDFPERQLIGKMVNKILPPYIAFQLEQKIEEANQTGNLIYWEFSMDTDLNITRSYESRIIKSMENSTLVLIRNITDQKNAELSLLTSNQRLKIKSEELINSNAELERFAYVASHDLQEPLRMVSNFLQLFKSRYAAIVDDTGKKYIDFAVNGSERMKSLIRDLLQYSRAGSGSLEIVDVDMNKLVNEVLLLFKNEGKNDSVTINVQQLPVIKAGSSAISQLMQNLIGNSLKYRKETHLSLEISVDENQNDWIFSIKDNGIGIAPEYFDKVFVIFQRLHTSKEYSGTGIGLSVCKKIVERYNGKIWVESVLGEGSTFKFSIPKEPIQIGMNI